jgi:hypothetical protein
MYTKAMLVALRFEDELAVSSSLLLAPTDRPSVEYVYTLQMYAQRIYDGGTRVKKKKKGILLL